MTLLMTPDMSNFRGNVHGGVLMKLLDQVAYTCASRYARGYARHSLRGPRDLQGTDPRWRVGDLPGERKSHWSDLYGGIRVTTQDPVHRHVRHANSCYFTMVSVDEGDRPTPCARGFPALM
jgi:acyl-CoA hydrolase